MGTEQQVKQAPQTLDDCLRLIREQRIEFIRFETPDQNGISRGKLVTAEFFRAYVEKGLALVSDVFAWDPRCGVACHTGFGEDLTFADLTLRADLSTFRALPWLPGVARVIADPYYDDGRPVMASPRNLFKAMVARAEEMGFLFRNQSELELYLLDAQTFRPPYDDHLITTTLTHLRLPAVAEIARLMPLVDVRINTINQEWGPTQYEINFESDIGVAAADQAFTFKTGCKEIARSHGLVATFMTKPFIDRSANGCHFHMSLIDKETGKNAFYDPVSGGLSQLAMYFLGGQIRHAKALAAVQAPTVNCAKRYKRGTYAPTSITWGHENRSVGIRVKSWRGERTHFENRMGGGAANPYLVSALCLAAGLDGIRRNIPAPEPITTNAYKLDGLDTIPTRLEDALGYLQADAELVEYLSPEWLKAYVALKRHELEKARSAVQDFGGEGWLERVDDWELREFAEML